MRYAVVFEKSGTGWGAYPPDLPGVGVTGKTLEETRELISKAIGLHVAALREDGDPVPEAVTHVEEVEAA